MNIIHKAKDSFNEEIYKIAKKNIIQKLNKQGIKHTDLLSSEFNELVEDEIRILESDTKKVGLGFGIGLVTSMLIGI